MTTAVENLGPHLLGRKPSPEDERDYHLADFLSIDPLDAALASVTRSLVTSPAVKHWAKLITAAVQGAKPAPSPTPTPPAPADVHDVTWADADSVLDQGQTPHCVGFGWAQWGNTLPIDDRFGNADGDRIYAECKVIDGEPGAQDGSDVRSGAKAMLARKRLAAYAFAKSVDEARAWVQAHGPVVFGTDWTDDMFSPDASGLVEATGAVAGGHCYVCVGDLPSQGMLLFQNSWGDSWGQHGRFKMHYETAATLLGKNGEACAAVELA